MAHYHGSTHYHLLWNMNSKFPYYSTSMVNPAAAFADEAGLMGVSWPPRSYSCSFCRRDFRSAQALGGHMNVHRRDRAKLNLKSHHNNNNITQKPQPTFGNGDNSVETRLSVGINYDYGPGSTVICKRSQKKEWEFMEDNGDDIDLELRLGDSPMLMK